MGPSACQEKLVPWTFRMYATPSGQAASQPTDLVPPLVPVWELPKAATHGVDGVPVGGPKVAYVPVRQTDVVAIQGIDGDVVWHAHDIRTEYGFLRWTDRGIISDRCGCDRAYRSGGEGSDRLLISVADGASRGFVGTDGIPVRRPDKDDAHWGHIPTWGKWMLSGTTAYDLDRACKVHFEGVVGGEMGVSELYDGHAIGLYRGTSPDEEMVRCWDMRGEKVLWEANPRVISRLQCMSGRVLLCWEALDRVVCRRLDTYELLWQAPVLELPFEYKPGIISATDPYMHTAVCDGSIYYDVPGTGERKLVCLDLATGQQRWQRTVPKYPLWELDRKLVCPDIRGPHASLGMVWTHEQVEGCSQKEGSIVARSAVDGNIIWRSDPAESLLLRLIMDGCMVVQKGRDIQCWASGDPTGAAPKPKRIKLTRPKPQPKVF